MPHIKTYCRYSDRGLYWFVLTSANISRSAWGTMSKGSKTLNPSLRINSYEAGVVFFPRVIIGQERFPMNAAQQRDNAPIFKLPFDIPPTPFGKDDVPYCAEYLKDFLAKFGVV
jgi:tyrosyl-DNA phosphodiesterase 1